MMVEHPFLKNHRVRQAIDELQEAIARRYPTATFEVSGAADDPSSIHLIAIVDVDDPDEVSDLVIDRVVELQVEEQIPIHVIPLRTPERVASEAMRYAVGRETKLPGTTRRHVPDQHTASEGGPSVTLSADRARASHYSMTIEWSDEDAAFVVAVPELPGCVTHGATYAEAVRQGEDAIETWLDAARASGDPIPPPRVFGRLA